MAIGNFGELKAAVASWIKRTDLTANIPDFIALGEARIARDIRLRCQLVDGTAVTVADDPEVALPTGWLEFERISVDGYGRLDPVTPDSADDYWARTESGRPREYAVGADALRLWPTPDSVYTLNFSYYQRLALSDAAPTNWLLTNHPGVYLWASLAEAEPFVINDSRVGVWEAKYRADLDTLRIAEDRARLGGTPLRIRAA